jgi:hypothetical protein
MTKHIRKTATAHLRSDSLSSISNGCVSIILESEQQRPTLLTCCAINRDHCEQLVIPAPTAGVCVTTTMVPDQYFVGEITTVDYGQCRPLTL